MLQRYKTEHANDVHQLVVAVSRHAYVTAAGKFRRQKKPFEARLDKPETFTKRHIVHYLIRDHFSGLFYAEVTDSRNLFPVSEFLYRAWSKKEWHPLHGVPVAVTVPATVRAVWPRLVAAMKDAMIEAIDVTSGFQAGVRDLRTWEDVLHFGLYDSGFPPDYDEVRLHAPEACLSFNTSDYGGAIPKAKVWADSLRGDTYVPASKDFLAEPRGVGR